MKGTGAARLINKCCALCPPGRFTAVVVVFSLAETALLAFAVARHWSVAGIPWHGQVVFYLLAALSIAAGSWLLYWLATGLQTLTPQFYSSRLGAIPLFAVLATASALYAMSWAYYWRTGMFLDLAAAEFAARNAGMMWEYLWQVERVQTIVLFAAAIVAALLILRYAHRRPSANAAKARNFYFTRGLVTFALAANLGILTAYLYGDPTEGPVVSKEWWRDQRPGKHFEISHRISPLLTMVANVVQRSPNEVHGELTADELGPARLAHRLAPPVQPAMRPPGHSDCRRIAPRGYA